MNSRKTAMEINYRNQKLKKLVSNPRELTKDYGDDVSKAVAKRIKDMEASETLSEYMMCYSGKCKQLTGGRKGQFSVRLDRGVRLVFAPDEQETPRKPDGGLDWSKITKIKILEIVNYHRKRK